MAERTQLLRFRRGTRAELLASTGNWKPGEPGYVTDENKIIVATLDAAANVNTFVEYGQYSTLQKSIISKLGTIAPFAGATAFAMFGLDNQQVSYWYRDFGVGKSDYIIPNSVNLKKINSNQFYLAATRTDEEIYIDTFPNLEELNAQVSCIWSFLRIWITGNPKLTTIVLPGNGASAGKQATDIYIWANPNLTSINLTGNVDLVNFLLGSTIAVETQPKLTSINLTGCTTITADTGNFALMVDDLPAHAVPGTGTFTVVGCTGIFGSTNWTGGTNQKGLIEAKNWTVVEV